MIINTIHDFVLTKTILQNKGAIQLPHHAYTEKMKALTPFFCHHLKHIGKMIMTYS